MRRLEGRSVAIYAAFAMDMRVVMNLPSKRLGFELTSS